MRAFLTGATGFVGSHLCRLLVESGEEVAVLMRARSSPWRIEDLLDRVSVIRGDIVAIDSYKDELAAFKPDIVYHLGWHGVSNDSRNNAGQVSENLSGGIALAEMAASVGCSAVIGVGSQAEYGPCAGAMDESAPTNPTTLYGAAKLSLYHLCRAALLESEVRFAWIRLFSAYGPMDNPNWMIPYLIDRLLDGKKPSLTLGEQKWDYIYVGDAVGAIASVGRTREAGGVFNLGSGKARPLRGVIESVRDLIDPTMPLGFGEVPYRPDQVMHLEADIRRLVGATGWRPKTDIAEGLRKTIEWHREKRKPV